METTTAARSSIVGLFRALTGHSRTFIRQEIRLAKTEVSEKLGRLGRNAGALAAGGVVAYAGLIVFFIGLGYLLAWAFQKAGVEPLLAGFVGLAIIGLLISVTGGLLLLKGIKTISREPLAPERTLYTLQELKGTAPPGGPYAIPVSGEPPSSKEMQARVEATENRLGETLDELGRRLSPQHINAEVRQRIQARPYRFSFIAMTVGVLSGLFLRRRFSHL